MLGWFTGLGWAFKLGIILAIVAVVGGTVWYVHHSIWKDGYAAAELKYKPQLLKAQADLANTMADLQNAIAVNKQFEAELKRLTALTREQQQSIDMFKQTALAAEIKLRKVLLDVAMKEKRYTAEIARLLAIVSGPPMTEGDCEEADSILRTLVRDRLRNDGGAAPAGGSPAPGGTSGGGGRAPVH